MRKRKMRRSSFVCTKTEKVEKSFLEELPCELKVFILDRCCPEDIRNVSHVNTKWRSIVLKNKHRLRRINAEEIRMYDMGDGNIHVNMVLQGELSWTKNVRSRTVPSEDVYEYIWPYETEDLHVSSHSDFLRRVFAEVPDYWFKDIKKLGVFENRCDVAVLSLISRCPKLESIFIDPCFTVGNVLEIVEKMHGAQDLKLLCSEKSIVADDRTLIELIDKSKKCSRDEGLKTFWVDTISTRFTLDTVQRFFLEASFGPTVSILLERISGRENDFLSFIQLNFEDAYRSGSSFRFRKVYSPESGRAPSEFTVMIGRFITAP